MASYLKEKITGAQSDVDAGNADKYFIQVAAATSYDDTKGKQITINGPPCEISKNAKAAVRIKEYQGLPLGSPATSSYFNDPAHSQDTYSIAVSWIPEEDIDADDLVWGIELINPIRDRIPGRFITTAFNIVKGFVDSSLRCDPNADQPWLNGPVLCSSAITFSIGSKGSCELPAILSEGSLKDDSAIRQKHNIPTTDSQRRKHFLDEHNRKDFVFEKGRCYAFDFHNGYIDWKNYALKLPGFSFGVLKYINDRTHTTRFVLKSRKTGKVCVATTFRLLYGEELEKAKKTSGVAATQTGENGQEERSLQIDGAEDQHKEPRNGNNPENSTVDQQTPEQRTLQGPKEVKEVHGHLEELPIRGSTEGNGHPSEGSIKSTHLPGSGSDPAPDENGDHAAEEAAEKVIEASEEKRQSEEHRESIEESLVANSSKVERA
ncbi:hypothetical protein D6D02_04286 [Aureobasidium pullulans]|nr:hypothetical protein D6D23_03395 [Aureobasidium pullulans]THW71415.1 hypothetical protein D6D25_00127 [Aureobasidium pullulans]THY08861.1 hypothetical protein D6D03_00717 [Aureobasidium pullulans]THY14467.1 hypothetical protein D6D02_04286 [Aureobasidium pullulans]THY46475.1 hypothetical protein D6C98_07457 [Aureobasidium pullulans]